jgi:hypothetical protein
MTLVPTCQITPHRRFEHLDEFHFIKFPPFVRPAPEAAG